jgi:agmatine deiminase
MIPDWQTTFVYFSRLFSNRHRVLWKQLTEILRGHSVPFGLLNKTRDIWARDYCPIQVQGKRFVKFRYCPDYLRGRYERLITHDDVCKQVENLGKFQKPEIILDGGNVVSGKNKAILTDKVYRENPKWKPGRLRSTLAELLHVDQCIMIPKEPGDPIGHSDGVVRFLKEDLVVVNDYSKVDPAYGKQLCAALAKHGLRIEIVPHFREDRSEDGIPSATGNYINFLRIGNLIVVPAYGSLEDQKACKTLERLCPKATVIPLECVKLSRKGGVLNCVAWTILAKNEVEADK